MRWRPHFKFTPGQYLTLRTHIDGRDVRRAYSICSGTADGELRVAIKRVEGGLFSNYACDHFAAGQSIEVMPPHGTFVLPGADGARHIVGCAAGSGVTPILSILKSVLASEPESRFTLFYGNRTPEDSLFHAELAQLSNTYGARLAVINAYSRSTDAIAIKGRLDDVLPGLIGSTLDASQVAHWFICGPDAMMDSALAAISALGVPADRIFSERFGGSGGVAPEGAQPNAHVSARILGKTHEFNTGSLSIADGAIAAGVAFPYSCGIGVCAICKARVTQGRAIMAATDTILTPEEIEEGYVLACCSYAATPGLSIDCDVD